ncbi:hypothetical protein [Pyxidicoccus xibeiensis]|uniref:hypothetical protein n=1 Tax=Pyxidicoccus xibeiensis TaxID=2906759 RepID=UPI0020A7D8FC|nr:hypothetical protein [Pyxidicoccus xibeiensis]MCP3136144.1 hypothetical protein [Pyxidicoccus xibeiensis]
MVQTNGRRALVAVLGAVLLGLGGCSSDRANTKVEDEWLARLPPQEMEQVRKARLTQGKAQDEITRAQVSLEDAKRALEVAKANEDAAKARREVDEAELRAAREMGQEQVILQVQERFREGDLEFAAAQAQVDYWDRVVTTRESLQEMRARELDVANAELEMTEYVALQRAGDVRARQLDGEALATRLAEARDNAWQTQQRVEANLQRQRQAQARWQQLDDQLEAYGGGGQQGP